MGKILNRGYLPRHYLSENFKERLAAYVGDYLKEEIAAESLVRNLGKFADFLNLAAISDTEEINFSTFARDVGVSSQTIKDHYQILVDTLLGFWLPLYKNRPKRRIQGNGKFYFFDVGVVNFLAKRHFLEQGSELFGKAFENWIAHELMTYNHYNKRFAELSYWQISTGKEVDFIVNDMQIAIEAKSSKLVNAKHLDGLRELVVDHPEVKRKIIVSCDPEKRITDDKIEILPFNIFVEELWAGNIF